MAFNRIRTNSRYTKASGLTGRSKRQMDVRHGQAVSINLGLNNEEKSFNQAIIDPNNSDYEFFQCDLPLQDPVAAENAYNTLGDGSDLLLKGYTEVDKIKKEPGV